MTMVRTPAPSPKSTFAMTGDGGNPPPMKVAYGGWLPLQLSTTPIALDALSRLSQ
jgi:hypothetical protein